MRVLVTGGAGFIGSHIVEHFQGIAEVRVLDNLRSGCNDNLIGLEHEFIEGSICDRRIVRESLKGVDYVFHLAAMISVPESMSNPIECNEINTTGTLVVLEEAARAHVKKLVFSSSSAIYGDNPATPKVETLVPDPKSPYAITKLDGEYYCKMFSDDGRLATAALRYFNVFGTRQNPNSAYAAAVPIFIGRALNNKPIVIHGDGEQTRDFIYVKDIAAANAFIGTQSSARGVFNVGCGRHITINDLAATVCRLAESNSIIQHTSSRPGDVKHSLAATEKLSAAGFTARGNFEENLKGTIQFFQDRLLLANR